MLLHLNLSTKELGNIPLHSPSSFEPFFARPLISPFQKFQFVFNKVCEIPPMMDNHKLESAPPRQFHEKNSCLE